MSNNKKINDHRSRFPVSRLLMGLIAVLFAYCRKYVMTDESVVTKRKQHEIVSGR